MKHVVTFGVFDLLHPGHLYFLRQAKKHGTHLTVVVTRDARARKEKGRKPFFNERERLQMVAALRGVDKAMLGDKIGEWQILKKLRPEVICVGYDQRGAWQSTLPRQLRIVRIKAYYSKRYKSSYARH